MRVALNEKQLELLQQELELLRSAAEILDYSYNSCLEIGVKRDYSYAEQDRIEAFTSRFARMSDLLIQRVFRLLDEIDLETAGTVRDRIDRAEKKGLIESADAFIEVRILRNDIAHEYLPEALREIFKKALSFTPTLLDAVGRVAAYCQRYIPSLSRPGGPRS